MEGLPSLHPTAEQAGQKTSSFCGSRPEGVRCRSKATWRRVPSTQPGAGHGTQTSSPAHTNSSGPGPTHQVSVLSQVACRRRCPYLASVAAQEQVHGSSRRRSTGAPPTARRAWEPRAPLRPRTGPHLPTSVLGAQSPARDATALARPGHALQVWPHPPEIRIGAVREI